MGQVIENKCNCHHWKDELDGVALKDGENLQIIWPDGSTETRPIRVVSVERGHHGSVTSHEAYFISKYRGRDTWARLLGLQASRSNP